MKGFIIAAGQGSRMGALTSDRPKCLLPIGNLTLLDHTVNNLRASNCSDISIIVGYKAETINIPDVEYIYNKGYESNNILHSFMKASEFIEGPLLATYSDIWVEPWVYKKLQEQAGDIVLAVDTDWEAYYEGRTDHPISEAENVYFKTDGAITMIGKHLSSVPPQGQFCGEFLGLWYMSQTGANLFRTEFDIINENLKLNDPFQHAKSWELSYITDMVQELIDKGHTIRCASIERGWAELDTEQDYKRLNDIAERQRLTTLGKIHGDVENF